MCEILYVSTILLFVKNIRYTNCSANDNKRYKPQINISFNMYAIVKKKIITHKEITSEFNADSSICPNSGAIDYIDYTVNFLIFLREPSLMTPEPCVTICN